MHTNMHNCASDFISWGHLKAGPRPPVDWSENRVLESELSANLDSATRSLMV